jgi:hypothetical protein
VLLVIRGAVAHAVHNAALVQVIRADLYLDPIAYGQANEVFSQLTGDMAEQLVLFAR